MGSIQFKIQLEGITPPIWRTFQVDASEAFFDLHEIIQIVMGWENAHLFEFHIKDRKIGLLPDDEQTWENHEKVEDSEAVSIEETQLKVGDTFTYIYDFGDSWEHTLTVEKMIDEDTPLPLCLDGKRCCPPEDCGGVPGYLDFLVALKDPKHPDHAEIIDWIDEFDAEEFDLEETNEILNEFNDWRQDLFNEEE